MAITHSRHPNQTGPILSFALIPLVLGLLIFSESASVAQHISKQRLSKQRRDPFAASTDRATMEAAHRQIPFNKLTPGDRAKAESVVRNVSLFRRLPLRVVQCEPEMFSFLMKHPDVVINIWQVLRLSNLRMQQTGLDTFAITDDTQTELTLRYIYRGEGIEVVYAEGACEGPLFKKPAKGQCLMVLRSGFVRETDGRDYLTCRLDSFLHVDQSGLELLTKTFQPILGKVADWNFDQTMGFVGSLSRTAQVNPAGTQRLASKLTSVEPEVRQEFAQVIERIAQRNPSQPSPLPIPAPIPVPVSSSPPQVAKYSKTLGAK